MGKALKALRSRARKEAGPVVNPLIRALETIEVPRAWIHEHGWPDTYDEIAALVHVEPGFKRHNVPRQEFVWQAEEGKNVAFFRCGDEGQAFLYVQSWRGQP